MARSASPCESCRRSACPELECQRWRIWYCYRQQLINAWARRETAKRYAWVYFHPEENAPVAGNN